MCLAASRVTNLLRYVPSAWLMRGRSVSIRAAVQDAAVSGRLVQGSTMASLRSLLADPSPEDSAHRRVEAFGRWYHQTGLW
jgi:hypothetical protein